MQSQQRHRLLEIYTINGIFFVIIHSEVLWIGKKKSQKAEACLPTRKRPNEQRARTRPGAWGSWLSLPPRPVHGVFNPYSGADMLKILL